MSRWFCVGLVVTLALGCGDKKPGAAVDKKGGPAEPAKAAPTGPKLDLKCDEATRKLADELAPKLTDDGFPYETQKKDNAKAFLCLAGTSKDAKIVAAALAMVTETYAEKGSESYEQAGDDFYLVVEAKLYDADPMVLKRAVDAAGKVVLMESPRAKIIDRLIELAGDHAKPEIAYFALDALFATQSTAENPKAMDALIKALDAKPAWLAGRALARVAGVYERHPRKADIKAKVVAALKSPEPGLRGNAVNVFASYWSVRADDAVKKEYIDLVKPLLDDPHPYVKSCAAIALAGLGHRPSIHKIVKLLDDSTMGSFSLPVEIAGKAVTREVFDPSNYDTVADSALYAIQTYSELTDKKLAYEPTKRPSEQSSDDWIKATAADYKKWYEEKKGEFPAE